MDISKYIELKATNNISLVSLGDSFAVIKKQYDTDTGIVKPQITEAIGRDQVLELKANLLKQLEQVEAVLKDMDILKPTIIEEIIK